MSFGEEFVNGGVLDGKFVIFGGMFVYGGGGGKFVFPGKLVGANPGWGWTPGGR